jgi:phosphatidate cytidylyltransferase
VWLGFSFFGQVPPLWHFLILGFAGGVTGQLGDLFASLIKRHCGIKDFGSIFPGHGGMMDRLDSVYWATVVMYVYLNLSGMNILS